MVDTSISFPPTSTSTVSPTDFKTSLSSCPSCIFTDASFAVYVGTISAESVVSSYSWPTTSPTTTAPTTVSPTTSSPTASAPTSLGFLAPPPPPSPPVMIAVKALEYDVPVLDYEVCGLSVRFLLLYITLFVLFLTFLPLVHRLSPSRRRWW